MANIISDIAGRYKTLLALIEKMPDDEVISIGDMIDRGPRSKEVLEWFMENGKAILGNHEHFMLDHFDRLGLDHKYYQYGVWMWNGGDATLDSFEQQRPSGELLGWIANLPLYMEIDGCLVSHAFLPKGVSLEKGCDLGTSAMDDKCDDCIIWSREVPVRRSEYRMQIAGHNSHMGLKRFSDEQGEYAICIDTSRSQVLTGIHLPSMEIYQQEYID